MNKISEKLETVYQGKHLEMQRLNGWEYVSRPKTSGIVAIVAITQDDEIVLVEQFRPPIRSYVLELPAGLVGDLDEDPNESKLNAAQRELLEETGFQSDDWQEIFTGPPSAGATSEMVTFFLARNAKRIGEGGGVENESIQTHVIPLNQPMATMIQTSTNDAVLDPKVLTGLWIAEKSMQHPLQ